MNIADVRAALQRVRERVRYQHKAQIVLRAWGALFGASPSLRALVRVLCVGEHETRLGDAAGWTHEHNWGALKKRGLSPLEQATLATYGVRPEDGQAALASARSLLHAGPNEALHTDSSPGKGPHFAWFWTFPSDEEAAYKFLQTLLIQRPRVREVLEHEDLREMAQAMYESHYYEGFHKGDPHANIADYARTLLALEPTIEAALLAPPLPEDLVSASAPPLGVSLVPPSPSRASHTGVVLLLSTGVLLFGSILAKGASR